MPKLLPPVLRTLQFVFAEKPRVEAAGRLPHQTASRKNLETQQRDVQSQLPATQVAAVRVLKALQVVGEFRLVMLILLPNTNAIKLFGSRFEPSPS
jgi:hypothetical protein